MRSRSTLLLILLLCVPWLAAPWGSGGGGGSGDVESVGDCATGACFTGSSGVTLTGTGSDSLNIGTTTANALTFKVDGTNTATLIGADAAGAANTTYDTTEAGDITLGHEGVDQLKHLGYVMELGNGATSGGYLRLMADTSDVGEWVGISTPTSLGATYELILPPDNGDNTEQLTTDGSGNLTWEAAGSGGGWTDAGTVLHPTTATDDLGDDASQTDWSISDAGVAVFEGGVSAGTVSDAADTGAINLDNADSICWEASAAGTDVCLAADSSEIIQVAGGTLDGADLTGASVTGDQIASSLAGRSLALTAGSPDVLDADAELYTRTWDVVLEAPADADDFCFARAQSAATLTRLDCVAQGGSTPSFPVTINECDTACASCATTGGTVTADGGLDSDTTFTDGAIASGAFVQFAIGSSSGSAGWLTCTVTYTLDD